MIRMGNALKRAEIERAAGDKRRLWMDISDVSNDTHEYTRLSIRWLELDTYQWTRGVTLPGVAILAAVLSHDDSLSRRQLGSQGILHWKFWAIVVVDLDSNGSPEPSM